MTSPTSTSAVTVNGIRVEMLEAGKGDPLLFLHPHPGVDGNQAFIEKLAQRFRVLAPSHPGFGASERPRTVNTIDDLAFHYLDLMEELDLRNLTVVGVSFGGWLAAEIATRSTERIRRLVLADALGIKVGDRETRDIADMFAVTPDQLAALCYADPALGKRSEPLSEDEAERAAQNWESLALYGWLPYMHNPKLRQRLHRIRVPSLVLWGERDGIVAPDYGRAFASHLPNAHFELIAGAGHFPHIEKPDAFVAAVDKFAGTSV